MAPPSETDGALPATSDKALPANSATDRTTSLCAPASWRDRATRRDWPALNHAADS